MEKTGQTINSLDRPIWHALNSRHSGFAEGGALARRYVPDVSPFAAAAGDSPEALAELSALLTAQPAVLLQAGEPPVPERAEVVTRAAGVQMVARELSAPQASLQVLELGEADAPDMLALATLTKPGPFLPRTHQLGRFIGLREKGRLVAMAGERLALPGYTEVSGVCTDPVCRGRGYAGDLTRIVASRILARGEVPFLHAYAGNMAAISLYAKLGFEHRCSVAVMVLRRA